MCETCDLGIKTWYEIRLPTRCEENGSAAGQNILLEEVGSKAQY